MDIKTANSWKNDVLDIVFEALAESAVIVDCMVFKGARILNKRLGSNSRQSLDIDANMLQEFIDRYQSLDEIKDVLEKEMRAALINYFEKQDPVVYELERIKAKRKPHQDHKLGWNAFEITISVKDLSRSNTRGMPNLKIDIAAPEELTNESVSKLNIGDSAVYAYTLERIAGEKLRAFLSSLPAYRDKVSKPGETIRAKDIYDIARILKQRPISEKSFWDKAGEEFVRACRSRYIDCPNEESFAESIESSKEAFNADPTLTADTTFEKAWRSLQEVTGYFSKTNLIPFHHPLPDDYK